MVINVVRVEEAEVKEKYVSKKQHGSWASSEKTMSWDVKEKQDQELKKLHKHHVHPILVYVIIFR